MTALLRAYGAASRIALPFALRAEAKKLALAGMTARLPEKRGLSDRPRPEGKLLWVHAASVGESLSALALIERFCETASVLVTSGTPTSATLMAKRLPARAQHVFAPLDAPGPVARFLDNWQPDAALFVESELWPGMLQALDARDIPRALVNARLSERSLKRWARASGTARKLLAPFRLVLTQTVEVAVALKILGAETARPSQNLKALAPPLPTDSALMALLPPRAWVAASTHPGEEDIVLNAQAILQPEFPDLTLILAPRHPERGDEVARMIAARGWPAPRRSKGEGPDGPVWLLDTLGELGSLYAGVPIVFLGGSMRPIGGHNPYEVIQGGAAALSGPHVDNFKETYAAFTEAKAVEFVGTAQSMADAVGRLSAHPPLLHLKQEASRKIASEQSAGLETIAHDVSVALGL